MTFYKQSGNLDNKNAIEKVGSKKNIKNRKRSMSASS